MAWCERGRKRGVIVEESAKCHEWETKRGVAGGKGIGSGCKRERKRGRSGVAGIRESWSGGGGVDGVCVWVVEEEEEEGYSCVIR